MGNKLGPANIKYLYILIWLHGMIAGIYFSDSHAESLSDQMWNVWWVFIWSLCLTAIYYIFKEKLISGGTTVPKSDLRMPEPDLSRYKKDEKSE